MVVWKYSLTKERTMLNMPVGADVLDVQEQLGVIQLWALVNPEYAKEFRNFLVVGTGQPISTKFDLKHVSTILLQGGTLVYHVFEII